MLRTFSLHTSHRRYNRNINNQCKSNINSSIYLIEGLHCGECQIHILNTTNVSNHSHKFIKHEGHLCCALAIATFNDLKSREIYSLKHKIRISFSYIHGGDSPDNRSRLARLYNVSGFTSDTVSLRMLPLELARSISIVPFSSIISCMCFASCCMTFCKIWNLRCVSLHVVTSG